MMTQIEMRISSASQGGIRPSVLKQLRRFIPTCRSEFASALQVAERQATALIELLGVGISGVQAAHLQGLPRIEVCYADLSVSGTSHWTGTTWLISINRDDCKERQRFTLLHEFKHIIDHGSTHQLYTGSRRHSAAEQAELAADYFAGCALVPRRALKAAWGNGIQKPRLLATLFGVSETALRVRLSQTGLDTPLDKEPTPRCARPVATPRGRTQRFQSIYPRRFSYGAAR